MKSIKQAFTVTIPCSTANLGPGFDSIGMALNRYLRLHFSPADHVEIYVRDPENQYLPQDDNNLIIQVMKKAFADNGFPFLSFRMDIDNDIPLARGLGSSAAATVGAVLAANEMMGRPWSQEEIFRRATAWEGHPDNVGPSLWGGVIIGSWDGKQVDHVVCEPPNIPILAVIPAQSLLTKKARGVLPEMYPRQEAILSSSRANLLTAALLSKRWDLLSVAMQDRFHHPYRLDLVPGLKESIAEAKNHGAWGVALSGGGPTLLAFVKEMESLQAYFKQLFSRLDIEIEMVSLVPVQEGAVVQLTADGECSTFVGNMIGV